MSLSLTVNDVNDNSPVCTKSLYSTTVSEAAAASTSVATVTCTDADTDSPNKDLTYTILTGNGRSLCHRKLQYLDAVIVWHSSITKE